VTRKSIGRWCRRYFGIGRRDELRSHFRLRQRLGQRANSLAQHIAILFLTLTLLALALTADVAATAPRCPALLLSMTPMSRGLRSMPRLSSKRRRLLLVPVKVEVFGLGFISGEPAFQTG
jgi:hypothetical protein